MEDSQNNILKKLSLFRNLATEIAESVSNCNIPSISLSSQEMYEILQIQDTIRDYMGIDNYKYLFVCYGLIIIEIADHVKEQLQDACCSLKYVNELNTMLGKRVSIYIDVKYKAELAIITWERIE